MIQNKTGIVARYPLAAVFIIMSLCMLPVMILRDFTPSNELRYLNIVDEAISEGHVFAFTLQGEPYADKPPLYFWLLILSRLIFGKHLMFFMSLFSFIPALVIMWVMDKWMALEGAGKRMSAALMLGTDGMFLALGIFLRMDMLMCMFIVLALYTFWKMYTGVGSRRSQEIMLPVYIFLALFTKGPVGLLMPPLAIIVFLLVKCQGRQIGRYLGWKTWAIIAALCLLWFTGVYLDGGKEYLDNLLFHQTVGRAVNSFHHKRPLWFYFGAIWYVLAPYCFLLVGAVVASLLKIPEGAKRRSDKEIFALVTVLTTFAMLTSFSSKLGVYLLPMVPFFIMLFMELVERTGWKKWMTWAIAPVLMLVVLICAVAFCVRLFAFGRPQIADLVSQYPIAANGLIWSSVAILGVGACLALYYLFKKKSWTKSLVATGLTVLLTVYVASFSLPELNSYIGFGNLCKLIPEGNEVVTLGVYRPENMDVYLHRDITDYHKEFKDFYEEEIQNRTEADGPLTVVIGEGRVKKDEYVKTFLQNHSAIHVGTYYLVEFLPGE